MCSIMIIGAFQVAIMVKNLPANAKDIRDQVRSLGPKIPWRRAWQPTPVFLPEESHGQRSLEGYSPQGHKESYMTEETAHTCGGIVIITNMSLLWLCGSQQTVENA